MSSPEPYRLTAAQVVAQIRSGTLTVEKYAQSLLAHIKQRDDAVKAWAYLDPENVLAQAKELDKVPPERRGPLHGVSIGVKDIIYTKDMPTQHNSPIYQGSTAGVDAGSNHDPPQRRRADPGQDDDDRVCGHDGRPGDSQSAQPGPYAGGFQLRLGRRSG